MKILWITWKSYGHPNAGGAEVVCHELCKRMIANGHSVTLLTSTPSLPEREKTPRGMTIIRVGSNRYIQPIQALIYYVLHLRNKYDVVIEEVNGGAPYFAVFFGRKSRRFILYHQLARRNWLSEVVPPFSWLGYYIMVPVATRLLSLSKVPVVTVSESTKGNLTRFGFPAENTYIISEGLHIRALKSLDGIKKYTRPTLLSHGSMRSMKRTIDQIKAFELAKQQYPELQMKLSGDSNSKYGKRVLSYIATSPYARDIVYLGRTSDQQKVELMQRCHAILVTSIEEGWGLIVTETNSQGTPAVVYNVNGLRDSVRDNKTGIITDQNPEALANGIVKLLSKPEKYEAIRRQAWEWSQELTFEQSYTDITKALGLDD